ncbi:F-box protein [Dorcoceras hygrometricum]|nr:F-box protein [Dorcoceras hygrometricum]
MDISLGNQSNGESRTESTVTFENRRRVEALGDLRVLPDEILCAILANLTPCDVARLSCVSSVMYILCNEEPLWLTLCLRVVNRQLEYKGSWKKTALHQLDLPLMYIEESQKKPLHFDGFTSLFLYKRLYRSYTTLHGFNFDNGNVDRTEKVSVEEFHEAYDGQKPVLINGLADNWPARKSWTSELLLLRHPDTKFKLSQRSSKKITMKFKDYISYMNAQHDEDPLYIFDEKFGETAPDLLKDYSVPQLFQEDYFDVLDGEQRPPFRWLIIGPERSGASWHVDPSLTSAWNTLLCGRKRWALYPPGRVPLGVTVHVNDEDGDVNIETPTSLQWWLEYYPVLSEHEKPIECTQLPGETIYVPSGWWHCVLNLETTIAVTQNFVNSKNFQFVCLDMAPGYQHKGVCRAGLLALDEGGFEDVENTTRMDNENLTRKEKKARMSTIENACDGTYTEGLSTRWSPGDLEYSYDINFLAKFVDKERDHYSSLWSPGNSIGQREMRNWLCKLWVGKPGLRDLIWKGACLALNADKWFERVTEVCAFHKLPCPVHDEKLPVGTGSNPVYLCGDFVIKIFVEGGLETSLYGLGTELEFHNILQNVKSPLKSYIPTVSASGILVSGNGSYRVFPWDGSCIPEVIDSHILSLNLKDIDYPFGIWSKKQFEYQKAQTPSSESSSFMWPYIVTKRCRGKIFAELRDTLSSEEALKLASFLGEQMCNLHSLPLPSPQDSMLRAREGQAQLSCCDGLENNVEWKLFISILNQKRKDVHHRLTAWGDPIPSKLIEKVDNYIPRDLTIFSNIFENAAEACNSCTWIHMDVMDDNIYMTPCSASISGEHASGSCLAESDRVDMSSISRLSYSWYPSHILDFSDLSIGENFSVMSLVCVRVKEQKIQGKQNCIALKQNKGNYT